MVKTVQKTSFVVFDAIIYGCCIIFFRPESFPLLTPETVTQDFFSHLRAECWRSAQPATCGHSSQVETNTDSKQSSETVHVMRYHFISRGATYRWSITTTSLPRCDSASHGR